MDQQTFKKVLQDFIVAKEQMKNIEAKVKKLQAIILSDPSFDSFTLGTSKVKRMARANFKLKEYSPEEMQLIVDQYPHCYKLDANMLAKEDANLVSKTESVYLQIYTVKEDAVGDGAEY